MALPDGLLDDIKEYLDITWVDEATDNKVTKIAERGIKYIDGIAGKTMDYTVEDKAKGLLLDYCRYARSNALEEFQKNYLHELITLQMIEEVAAYEANNTTV